MTASCVDFVCRADGLPANPEAATGTEETEASSDGQQIDKTMPARGVMATGASEASASQPPPGGRGSGLVPCPLWEAGLVVVSHCLVGICNESLQPDARAMLQTIREADGVTALVAIAGRGKGLSGKLACNSLLQLAPLLAPPQHSQSVAEAAEVQKFSQDAFAAIRREISFPALSVEGPGRLLNLVGTLVDRHDPCMEALLAQGLLPALLALQAPFKASVIRDLLPSILSYCEKHKQRLRGMVATAPDSECAKNIRSALKYCVSPAGLACQAGRE